MVVLFLVPGVQFPPFRESSYQLPIVWAHFLPWSVRFYCDVSSVRVSLSCVLEVSVQRGSTSAPTRPESSITSALLLLKMFGLGLG